MKNSQKQPDGFTIIELLIATSVFAIVLMVFLAAFLRISQLFYKGVSLSNTQEAARTLVQSISDDYRLSHGKPLVYDTHSPKYFCIGNHRYVYQLDQQVDQGNPAAYGVIRQNITSCTPPSSTTGEELLGSGMQLNKLKIDKDNTPPIVSIHVVFYGDDPHVLLSPGNPHSSTPWNEEDAQCSGSANSSEFCATADYSGVILQGI